MTEERKYVIRFEDKEARTVAYSQPIYSGAEAVDLAKKIHMVWFTPEEWKTKRLTVEHIDEVSKILWDSEAAA